MLIYSPYQGTHSFPAAWFSSNRSPSINFPSLSPGFVVMVLNGQRHLGLLLTIPLLTTSCRSIHIRLLISTGYLWWGGFLVSRQGSNHIPPATTRLMHLSSWPDRHKQRTGLIRPMLLSSLAIWIGGLECSHDVILSFSRPHLTTLHPQTSC